MVNILNKIILFLSAFCPMYIILLVKSIIQIELIDEIKWDLCNLTVVSILCILILLSIIYALIILYYNQKNANQEKIILVSAVNKTDNYFLGYFSIFVLLSLSFDIGNMYSFIILAIIMIFIACVYISNSLYYINPLFNILGFKFFNVKYRKLNNENIFTANIISHNNLEKKVNEEIQVYVSGFSFTKEV